MERLAAWGLQFTSQVSLHPPWGLLLELAGSRCLFGGTGTLIRRIAQGMRELGYRPCLALALAPTPEGAWLLAPPQRLELRDGRPWYRGALRLEPERERIESGWWDAQEVRRDYFVAHTCQGERLWVYLDLGGRAAIAPA